MKANGVLFVDNKPEKILGITNGYNVKKIHYISPDIQNFCPLGKDFCTYKVVVDMIPAALLFDYDVLSEFISEMNNGERTREQFAFEIYTHLIKNLAPKSLQVTVYNTADNSYIII